MFRGEVEIFGACCPNSCLKVRSEGGLTSEHHSEPPGTQFPVQGGWDPSAIPAV